MAARAEYGTVNGYLVPDPQIPKYLLALKPGGWADASISCIPGQRFAGRLLTGRFARWPGSRTGSLTGCQRPQAASRTWPRQFRNTCSDGTSGHIWHYLATLRNHLATLRNRPIVKQVHRETAVGLAGTARSTPARSSPRSQGTWWREPVGACAAAFRQAAVRLCPSRGAGSQRWRAPGQLPGRL